MPSGNIPERGASETQEGAKKFSRIRYIFHKKWRAHLLGLVVIILATSGMIYLVVRLDRGQSKTAQVPTGAVAAPSRRMLEWNIPLGRTRSQTIEVDSAGSDTIPIPREFDILLTMKSDFEYITITPLGEFECMGESCPGMNSRYEWVAFRSKTPGSITFWFEPHIP